jgi:thioesterase domain-containing protein
MGGIIAFEMAQQLVAGGEEAPHLALVDTWHPSSIPPTRGAPVLLRPFIFLVGAMRRHLAAVLRLPPHQAVRYLREKSALLTEMLFYRDVYRGDRQKRYGHLVFESNYRAGSRYIPAPYPGRVHLFLAGDRNGETATDTRLAWCDLSGDSVVVRNAVTGVMDLLKKPYVNVFAERLAEWMRDAHLPVAD